MDNQTEVLSSVVEPSEHLGRKIYQSKSAETITEINKAVSSFKEKLGPNSAKFVQLLIMEEKPNYPGFTQQRIDASVSAHAHVFQEIAEKDPFGLLDYVDTRKETMGRMIQDTKEEGAAKGISEKNNPRLEELGKAAVLIDKVIQEISAKYPKEYLETKGLLAR